MFPPFRQVVVLFCKIQRFLISKIFLYPHCAQKFMYSLLGGYKIHVYLILTRGNFSNGLFCSYRWRRVST